MLFDILPESHTKPFPQILDAIRCIRAEGIKTALLTNNWKWNESGHSVLPVDPALFDVVRRLLPHPVFFFTPLELLSTFYLIFSDAYFPFRFFKVIESWRVGLRKPDRRIYDLVLRKLQVDPHEAVFLDDLGHNLKSAKELGIRTIQVQNPDAAIKDLEQEVGCELRGFVPGTIAVPQRMKLDKNNVSRYLRDTLQLQDESMFETKFLYFLRFHFL